MHVQTLKGPFYILESAYVVERSEGEYRTVARLSGSKRLSCEVPFQWIANNTRITLQHNSYGSIVDFLEHAQKPYRRDLLATSDVYIEMWTEKDEIACLLVCFTDVFDVSICENQSYASTPICITAQSILRSLGRLASTSAVDGHRPMRALYLFIPEITL